MQTVFDIARGTRRRRAIAVAATLVAGMSGPLAARPDASWPNIPLPTLGGKQFWSDRYLFSGWRIQENVLNGHARLLDPRNVRPCRGGFHACRAAFDRIRADRALRPYDGHLIILVHGLGRSRASFGGLQRALRSAGYQVEGIEYPSMRRSLARNADDLQELIEALEGVDRISFVTHSLGGLLVRDLLSRRAGWRDRIDVDAVIMIASPSRGAAMADMLEHVPPINWIMGAGLAAATSRQAATLPAPEVPFGIIAAGRGGNGYNPLLHGDDDMLVTVEETRLAGAADWIRVNATHTFVMNHPDTIRATLNFLDHKRFGDTADGNRNSAATTRD